MPKRSHFSFSLLVVLFLVTSVFGQKGQEEKSGKQSKENASTLIGTWQLTADWGKAEKSNQILTITGPSTATMKDLDEGESSKVRNLKIDGNYLSFSYSFSSKQEFEIEFEGKLKEGKLFGTYGVLGYEAKVVGQRGTKEAAAKNWRKAKTASPLDAFEARTFTSTEGDTLPYRLFVPTDYDPKKSYPLVLFHHGGGGTGTDNRRNLEGACVREWITQDAQAKNPCLIVAPQMPGKNAKTSKSVDEGAKAMQLHIRTVHEILDSLEKEFSVDKSREYVTGLSFGGTCAWLSLHEQPERFAAAVPICAGNWLMQTKMKERGEKFANQPLWIFHGDADKVISVEDSRQIVKALRDAGADPKYTEYAGVGHYCWDMAYRDEGLIRWLFSQKLAGE
ncbi:MAG: dienelactone hydrolase family protein [Planctomycetota bacterium]